MKKTLLVVAIAGSIVSLYGCSNATSDKIVAVAPAPVIASPITPAEAKKANLSIEVTKPAKPEWKTLNNGNKILDFGDWWAIKKVDAITGETKLTTCAYGDANHDTKMCMQSNGLIAFTGESAPMSGVYGVVKFDARFNTNNETGAGYVRTYAASDSDTYSSALLSGDNAMEFNRNIRTAASTVVRFRMFNGADAVLRFPTMPADLPSPIAAPFQAVQPAPVPVEVKKAAAPAATMTGFDISNGPSLPFVVGQALVDRLTGYAQTDTGAVFVSNQPCQSALTGIRGTKVFDLKTGSTVFRRGCGWETTPGHVMLDWNDGSPVGSVDGVAPLPTYMTSNG